MGIFLLLFLIGSGLYLSLLSKRNIYIVENAGFHAVVLPTFAALSLWMMYLVQPPVHPEEQGPYAAIPGYAMLAIMPVGFAWAGYLSAVFAHYLTVAGPRWWMGDHKLKMPVTFDRGDAAMKKGDFPGALAFFKDELARHPDSPDLFLRMAEVHKALGDAHQVLVCMREAARCTADPHRKGPILIQLSERCQRTAEWGEAAAVLKGMLEDPALSDYHAAARSRLAALERTPRNP